MAHRDVEGSSPARPPLLAWAPIVFAFAVLATAVLAGHRTSTGDLSASVVMPIAAALAVVVSAWMARSAPRAAGWMTLTLLGWGANLVLIDAPRGVAYQHLRVFSDGPAAGIALAVTGVQLVAILVAGRDHVAAVARWCRENVRLSLLFLALVFITATAAAPSANPAFWVTELGQSTLLQAMSLMTLVAAARSVPESTWRALSAITERVLGPANGEGPRRVDGWVLGVAAAVVVVAAVLNWLSYERHPHVPDEVVYLMHARYFAEGMLTMPPPAVPAAFNVDLLNYEPTRFYSPVPPGWPFVLAVGAWLGVPWLVNPVLGGVAIILTYLVMGRITDVRETRLTTLLLATSPWFLFMAMNFMTHTATLVFALAATLGVAVARQNGSWVATFTAGLAVGAASLVRPLEGLVTAVLLGFWSLGAKGRRLRLAPSAALVAGTLVTGLLDRPYNAILTGSASVYPIMAYVDKYYTPGSNDMGFGPDRGLGWTGLDAFPGHGARDVVANAALNTSQVNVELLGWPIGAVAVACLVLALGAGRISRRDWWFLAVIATVAGAHSFYWFSGGPDFGARYWYLIVVPACALVARGLRFLDESKGPSTVSPVAARTVSLVLMAATLLVYVPWRAIGKYHHYRGMRGDVPRLAAQHEFGRSLVLVRGKLFPDYASAAPYNPIDLHADAPIYAWDPTPEIRSSVLDAYPDRTVWILDGPSMTGGAYRVVAGPLTPAQARTTSVAPHSSEDEVRDPTYPNGPPQP